HRTGADCARPQAAAAAQQPDVGRPRALGTYPARLRAVRSQRLGNGASPQHASAHLAAHPRQARPARTLIIAQLLLNALALGMAYALVALGFVLALNAAGAVNFAHGDLVVLGGAGAVFIGLSTGLPAVLLLPLVALAIGVVGILAARIAILPLASRPPKATFVAPIALSP